MTELSLPLLIGAVLAAMLVVMLVGWFTQRAANDGGWTDVFWTYGTGVTCALAALAPFGGATAPTWRQGVIAALVLIWSLRLGTYIFLRVRRGPQDARYVDLKSEWGASFQSRMLGLLLVQAPITALLAASVVTAARVAEPGVRVADVAGVLILFGSILGETLADRQMQAFKADRANRGKVCDTGLWAWSRHPNYLFEFTSWLAYPAIALDPSRPVTWLSLMAPAVMFCILRYGTGVPPLEVAMVKSKGDAYRRYQARVSPFLPRPPLSKDASQ